MQGKRVSESEIVLLHSPMPDETNDFGNMHGGHLLKLIDNVGGIVARRHARTRVVTASLERMDFLTPIIPGELVILKASVNMTGKTSLEVGIRVEAENLDTGAQRHAATCYMTFVAIDEHAQPKPVPPLIIEGETEERRYLKAQERRRYRNMLRQKVADICLYVLPGRYAICHAPEESLAELGGLLRNKDLVLSLTGLSPEKLCHRAEDCPIQPSAAYSSGPQPAGQEAPDNATGKFAAGLSLVIKEEGAGLLPPGSKADCGWRCLAFYGPEAQLSHTGIIANLSSTLANANVSIFFLSTFDGNFLLLKEELLNTAIVALNERGYLTVNAE